VSRQVAGFTMRNLASSAAMPTTRLLMLAAWLPFAACSKPLLQDEAGKLRVVAQIVVADAAAGAVAVRAAVREHSPVAVVIGLDATAAQAIAGMARATGEGGAEKCRCVTIGPSPAPGTLLDSEVRVVDDSAAGVAVDLAVLWLQGVQLPTKLPLGTRIVTAANAAAGGSARPAPGDLVVSMLRSQHAALLGERPGDAAQPVGLLRANDTEQHRRTADEVRAAASRHRHITLHERNANGDAAALPKLATELLDVGCRVLLVAPDDPAAVAAITALAEPRKAAVFALDPTLRAAGAVCVLGADQEVLGRAAGEHLVATLPNGGNLVLVQASASPHAEARTRGLAAAMGLRQP
jgi:hypothetical protein